jgi:hypothetical protein
MKSPVHEDKTISFRSLHLSTDKTTAIHHFGIVLNCRICCIVFIVQVHVMLSALSCVTRDYLFQALADLAAEGVELISMEGDTIKGTNCGRLMSR